MQQRPQPYQPNLGVGTPLSGSSPLEQLYPYPNQPLFGSTLITNEPLFQSGSSLSLSSGGGSVGGGFGGRGSSGSGQNSFAFPTVGQSPLSTPPVLDGVISRDSSYRDPLSSFQSPGNDSLGFSNSSENQTEILSVSPLSLLSPNDGTIDASPNHQDLPGDIAVRGDGGSNRIEICAVGQDGSQSLPLRLLSSCSPSNQHSPLITPPDSARPISQTPTFADNTPFAFGKPFSLSTKKTEEEGRVGGVGGGTGHHRSEFLLDAPPASERLIPEMMPPGRSSSYRSKMCAFFYHLGHCQKGEKCNYSHEFLPGMEVPPHPSSILQQQQQQQQQSSVVPISVGNSPQISGSVPSPIGGTRVVSPTSSYGSHTSNAQRLMAQQQPQPGGRHSAGSSSSGSSGSATYRTKPCRFFFEKGTCLKGDRCNFSHDPTSLQQSPRLSIQGRTSPVSSSAPTQIFIPTQLSPATTTTTTTTSPSRTLQLPLFCQQSNGFSPRM